MKKEGTTDPFANDDEDEQTTPTDNTTSQTDESHSAEQSDSTPDQDDENQSLSGGNTGQTDWSNPPRIVARDSVKEDRDGGVHQLFVYEETDEKEKEIRRDIEDRFDKNIYKLDVREAMYLVGMNHADEVEEVLREWGADI